MTKKQLFFLALALGTCLLAACGGTEENSSSGAASGSASGSSPAASSAQAAVQPMDLSQVTDPFLATAGIPGDAAVARAGEYDIPAADMLYWLNYDIELYLSQTGASSLDWDAPVADVTLKEYLTRSALETSAFYRLLPVMAQREGLELSQEDLNYPEEDMAAGAEQLGGQELMDLVLWYQLRTRESYRDAYRAARFYSLLSDHWYGEGSGGYPTDAEVRAYADGQGYYKVKHILLSTKEADGSTPLDEAAVAEKKAQADGLLAQLRAAEDPIALFSQLMDEYGEDPGQPPEGYDAYKGQMVPEFEQASLALKDGEISGVVESDFGYHIILRLPLEVEQFRLQMIADQMEERSRSWLEENKPETTEAWDSLDLDGFRANVLSLQAAVQEELQARAEAEEENAAPDAQPQPEAAPAPDGSAARDAPAVMTGIADADGGLNLRSGPGSEYESAAVIPKGAEVTLLEDAGGGWYKAEYNGVTGYISGDYVITGSN